MDPREFIAQARRRRRRIMEIRSLCSGAALVLTGLLLAATYLLLTNQFPA